MSFCGYRCSTCGHQFLAYHHESKACPRCATVPAELLRRYNALLKQTAELQERIDEIMRYAESEWGGARDDDPAPTETGAVLLFVGRVES